MASVYLPMKQSRTGGHHKSSEALGSGSEEENHTESPVRGWGLSSGVGPLPRRPSEAMGRHPNTVKYKDIHITVVTVVLARHPSPQGPRQDNHKSGLLSGLQSESLLHRETLSQKSISKLSNNRLKSAQTP